MYIPHHSLIFTSQLPPPPSSPPQSFPSLGAPKKSIFWAAATCSHHQGRVWGDCSLNLGSLEVRGSGSWNGCCLSTSLTLFERWLQLSEASNIISMSILIIQRLFSCCCCSLSGKGYMNFKFIAILLFIYASVYPSTVLNIAYLSLVYLQWQYDLPSQ